MVLDENSAPTQSNFNEGAVISRINDLNNGATPVTSKDKAGSASQKAMPTPTPSASAPKINDLKDKYRSAVIKTSMGDIVVEFFW
jgi:hypothetical protein